MKNRNFSDLWPLIVLLATVSCGQRVNKESTQMSVDSAQHNLEYGKDIIINAVKTPVSTTKYAKIVGWKAGETPEAPSGYRVVKFAGNLNSPRNIYVAPNGDIFVSQARTEKEGEEQEKKNSRNIFESPSPNNILRFRDTNQDGVPEIKETFLSDLNQPYGMLMLGDYFYVANTDSFVRYPYDKTKVRITGKGEKLASLPAGGYNNHWTRNLIAHSDGTKIYISIGSASNVGENGMGEEKQRANILEVDPDGKNLRIYASGLRNPVGMDWEKHTGKLWTAVNERDELGDELVPDYITSVSENTFYGWPYTYWGQHIDPRWINKAPDSLVKKSITPDFAIGAHTASLGLAFNKDSKFKNGAYIGQHGSWNRSTFSGYKILFVPFENGKPNGEPEDFLTGFIANEEKSEVRGRPVAVVFTTHYMLVADDASNAIWAVIPDSK
ncbi:PQQ-dependent sugar dehydrogenase [Sphingobacterium olei]|nr:sorbosone dehydrogenase family protein [Sphingobacterium olei]